MADKRLEGKVALVTGAGRGMGQAIALRLAHYGAAVVVHYANSSAGARDTVQSITASGGRAISYGADIAKREEVVAMFEAIDRDERLSCCQHWNPLAGSLVREMPIRVSDCAMPLPEADCPDAAQACLPHACGTLR